MAAPYTSVVWSDDFAGATTGAFLYNRTASGKTWTVDAVFAANRDGVTLNSGGYVQSSANTNGAFASISTGAISYRVRGTYTTNAGAINDANMMVAKGINYQNMVYLTPWGDAGWEITTRSASSTGVRHSFITAPANSPIASTVTSVALEIVEGTTSFNIKVFLNGTQYGTVGGYDVLKSIWASAQLDGAQRAGFFNKGTTAAASAGLTLFELLGDPVAAESITINSNAYGRRVFQRAHGTTAGTVTAGGTYTGTPAAIECRVVSFDGVTVISNWATTGVTFSGGTWAFTRSGIPQGGWYKIEARHSNNTSVLVSSGDKIGVGIGIIVYGQSNANGACNLTNGAQLAANDRSIWYDGSAWGDVPAANALRQIAAKVVGAMNIPVFLTGAWQDATASSGFVKGQTPYTNLMARITATGGKVEWMVYIQGESDSNGTTYTTNVNSIRASLAADMGITNTQLKFGMMLVPRDDAAAPTDQARHNIWKAINDLCQTAGYYLLGSYIDVTHAGNTLHPNAAGQDKGGQRAGQSIAFYEGAASYGGKGPKLVSAAITGQYIDLTFDLGGQTGLALSTGAGAFAGFEVSKDDFATTITIVSIAPGTPSANKARLDMGSANLSGTIKVRIFPGSDPVNDDSKVLVGTPA